MGEYADSFKEAMVKKMTGSEPRSATLLAVEVGVPQSTLSRWMRQYGRLGAAEAEGSMGKRTQQWGPEEKLRAVLEYEKLDEEVRGKYLREKGLYSVDVERWRLRRWPRLASGRRTETPRGNGSGRSRRSCGGKSRRLPRRRRFWF